MRKFWVSLSAAAALLVSNNAVRADIINFGYTASSAVNPVDNSSSLYNTNNPMQTSSVVFTPASGAASYDGTTGVSSQFIVYNMKTVSTATAGPGTYDTISAAPFNLSVTITDLVSSSQNALNFSGTYSADHVSSSSSHVDPSTQGITWTTPLTATQAIGNNTYTMSIISWTAPGAPGSAGSILAEVTAVPGPGTQSGPPTAPEPTSLVLAGLALPALLAARRRMKKAAA